MSDLTDQLEAAGQHRLVASLAALPPDQANRLAVECAALDLPLIVRLVEGIVTGAAPAPVPVIGPADVDRLPIDDAGRTRRAEARHAGEQALRDGRVAVVLLAGGQGTRLGSDSPKGEFPIGPVSHASLIAIHAAGVGATRRRYGCDLPWFVMTSDENDEATRTFLNDHLLFGLTPGSVTTFVQGMLPTVDRETGDILREATDHLALAPDGHGGVFRALEQAAILGDLEERGIDIVMTFQVDNPLMRPADPEFIGAHILARAEMSTLVVAKTGPDERMGVMATVGGSPALVEYTDLPAHLAAARDADGDLTYWAGSTGAHCLDRAFATRIGTGRATLPVHRAEKTVVTVDGAVAGIKFEAFMFDALPLAARTVSLEVARDERFAPVKDPDGAASPDACRVAIVERAARWLERAGVSVPRDAEGMSVHPIEIDPGFALDPDELMGRVGADLVITGPLVLR
ncbi:MAG: UDPGP type 1 family protein [Thermoleophilia bacterium]|nr:UDPGP type 1 family protein [Thermoleophilia bacterium]